MTTLAITQHAPLRTRWRQWRARWSPGYRRVRRQYDDTVRTVSVTITADTTQFLESLARTQAAVEQMRAGTGERRATLEHVVAHRRELAIVGGESRWYIRGAWAGSFVTPDPGQTLTEARAEDRDIQVQAMLTARMHPRWVAAYIKGWCESYGTGDRDPYIRHTLWSRHVDPRQQAGTPVIVRAR